MNTAADLDWALELIQDLERFDSSYKPRIRPPQDERGRVTTDHLLDKYIARARSGTGQATSRNDMGTQLAIQLRDNGYGQEEAEPVMRLYAQTVGQDGDHPYTESEAMATLRSVYSRPPREPWGAPGGSRAGGNGRASAQSPPEDQPAAASSNGQAHGPGTSSSQARGRGATSGPGTGQQAADAEFESVPWPNPPSLEAYHGLAGDFVRIVEPHTEADPVSLLSQLLVGFGNLIDRTAHFIAEADYHFLNEFLVLMGRTAKGRKGSSWGRVRGVLNPADPIWAKDRIMGGLSSGEGLIWHTRDRVFDKKGDAVDEGVDDKRLQIFEPEFASILRQMERSGNTLSSTLRQGWDTGNLQTMTKNSPTKATGAHISLIGHCTVDELRRYLTATEMANGFGNRHLWVCVRRSKVLPEGGSLNRQELAPLEDRLVKAVEFARGTRQMQRDDEARQLWAAVYGPLSEGQLGMAGAMLARAESHVMRLACIYALLDLSSLVRTEHLKAALALWEYCKASVLFVFKDSLGDATADEILQALRRIPAGLTRSDLTNLFQRNKPASEIVRALGVLLEHGLARFERRQTGGRPEERWFAVSGVTR